MINSENEIYAATNNNGVYISTNNGDTWNQLNTGLTTNKTYSLAVNSNGYLFAGTYGNGVFRSINSTITNSVENYPKPSSYSLSQNYPNPFNPNTKIQYSVPQSSQVVIKVFDILGNEIATLVNEEKPAGNYEVEFNGATLPSGVYFYQLKAGNFVETKKMILIR